jgi:hypothetical protein
MTIAATIVNFDHLSYGFQILELEELSSTDESPKLTQGCSQAIFRTMVNRNVAHLRPDMSVAEA